MTAGSAPTFPPLAPCRLLSLDGGGAKGFYTLGVLKEVEAMLARPLSDHFALIFGTSTGSVIAALLALGRTVDEIHALYRDHVPTVMRAGSTTFPLTTSSREAKSRALANLGETVFGDAKFDKLKTNLGIIATQWMFEKPLIFKSSVDEAYGQKATFSPGFGCTISDAVQASCSAYPFFARKTITKDNGDRVEAMDGGYCANNPTLYGLADAVIALNKPADELRVLSVGVGMYPEPKQPWQVRLAHRLDSVQLLQKTLNVNTNSMEQLRNILFGHIRTMRVSDSFTTPEMATDLLEHNLDKLNVLYQRGRESYGQREAAIKQLLLS